MSLAADGSFVFEPGIDADFDVSFTYRVGDGRSWSGPITVSIDVVAANDPPEAFDDYYGATASGFTFVADPGEYRWDSFTYTACDPGGCAMGQVSLEVFEAN